MNLGHENPSQMNTFGSIIYLKKKKEKEPLFYSPYLCPVSALSRKKIDHLTVLQEGKSRAWNAITIHINHDSV